MTRIRSFFIIPSSSLVSCLRTSLIIAFLVFISFFYLNFFYRQIFYSIDTQLYGKCSVIIEWDLDWWSHFRICWSAEKYFCFSPTPLSLLAPVSPICSSFKYFLMPFMLCQTLTHDKSMSIMSEETWSFHHNRPSLSLYHNRGWLKRLLNQL